MRRRFVVVLAILLAALTVAGCMRVPDVREEPDRQAAALLAGRLDDPRAPGTPMPEKTRLIGQGVGAHGSAGNAGRLWTAADGSGLATWQYVYRYSSRNGADKTSHAAIGQAAAMSSEAVGWGKAIDSL